MNKLKQLAGDTATYGLGSIVGRAINFLLVPFYTSTQILSIADYGIVSELYAYAAVLNVIYLYGMETAFFRFVSKNSKNADTIFNTSVSSIFFSSIGLSLLLAGFATPIVNWLEFAGQERFIYWFAAILAIDALVAIPFAKLRYERKAGKFVSFRLINIFLNIAFNIFFLYFCKNIYTGNFLPGLKPIISLVYNANYSVEYVFISNLLANLIFVPLFAKTFAKVKFGLNWSFLKPMFLYSYPLLFSQLAGVTNEMFSRMILKKMLPEGFYPGLNSQEALSIFAACYKLSIFMTLAIQAFRFAAEPFFFQNAEQKDSKEIYAKVYYYFVIVGSFAFLAISLNLDLIKHIFLSNPAYWQGLHVVPILLIANLFLGIYYNISIWFKIKDKTYIGTFISISAAILTIALNIILIPHFGYEGSAIITLITYFYMSLTVFLIGKKYYPIPYNLKKTAGYFLIALVFLYAGWHIESSSAVVKQLLKEIPVLLYILIFLVAENRNFRFNEN